MVQRHTYAENFSPSHHEKLTHGAKAGVNELTDVCMD